MGDTVSAGRDLGRTVLTELTRSSSWVSNAGFEIGQDAARLCTWYFERLRFPDLFRALCVLF